MSEGKRPEDHWAGFDEKALHIWMFEWWSRTTSMGLGLMQGMSSMYFQQMKNMLEQFKDHDPK